MSQSLSHLIVNVVFSTEDRRPAAPALTRCKKKSRQLQAAGYEYFN
jgi:hypothetical protein